MSEISDQGIVLRLVPFGDSSWIAHLLTEEHGRIHVMARGARRPKSDLRSALQPLHMLSLRWRPGRTGMGALLSVERGAALAPDTHFIAAQRLTAVVAGLFPEGSGEAGSLSEVVAAFGLLAARDEESGLLAACWWLLKKNGWLGELDHCWRCGVQDSELFWSRGCLQCARCGGGELISLGLRRTIPGHLHSPSVILSGPNIQTWRKMVQNVLVEHGMKPLLAGH
ncbi:MAG: DNA repair protein RecO [Mariprofundaceae bacterium]